METGNKIPPVQCETLGFGNELLRISSTGSGAEERASRSPQGPHLREAGL